VKVGCKNQFEEALEWQAMFEYVGGGEDKKTWLSSIAGQLFACLCLFPPKHLYWLCVGLATSTESYLMVLWSRLTHV